MCLEILSLDKEYAKRVRDCFFFMHVSLENALQRMEYFYCEVHISREQVCLNQKIVNEEPIFFMDKSDM